MLMYHHLLPRYNQCAVLKTKVFCRLYIALILLKIIFIQIQYCRKRFQFILFTIEVTFFVDEITGDFECTSIFNKSVIVGKIGSMQFLALRIHIIIGNSGGLVLFWNLIYIVFFFIFQLNARMRFVLRFTLNTK